MNTLQSVNVGMASLLAAASTLAQDRTMMNGGAWGSGWMGGYWMAILVLAVVVGLVVWVVKQQKK
ncbi:MAG: hypothetical protein RQ826_02990 [Xanthomonadales bacterium]|nr:hypothetical protein [Xanthomonadales bacterium]